ncbi:unconventional myosin-xv-like [Limosa lapponica baueri]|uniref:Unconventional myosin-xv-like n=1 Tax=Limosa lapponica baueri TaxID=1758121 RepID=A0A2I0TWS1_LIMLA|nr:unconventional myosin-xv-like [Limosa lapponica baueri]
MPPSRSKTRHKRVGKEKGLNCEKKASSPGDSKIHCGRRWEGKSKGQLKGKESLPEQDNTLEEDPLKSQRLVWLQGSKENDHKKLFRGKRAYKRKDKRESGPGRKHGKQLVPKLEGKKEKACKQQEMTSGQESEDSSDKEEKATTDGKKHSFKKKCGKCPAVSEKVTELESVKSIVVQSVEGSLQKNDSRQKAHSARRREKRNENHGFKEASEHKSDSQSQGSMTQGKGERTGKKQVGKCTRIIVTESAEENILETSDNSCSDSSSEGHLTHKKGTKEAVMDSTASSEEKSSSSEEDGISEKEAVLEDPPVAEGKGCKELPDERKEASNETERDQVNGGKNESEDEGTDFVGLEAEEKMKKEDDMPRQLKSILAERSEEDHNVSISGFQLESPKNRENGNNKVGKKNMLENDEVQAMSKDVHDNSDSNGENSTEEIIDKGKENATKQPLPSAVKAKLHVCLSKVLQGTEQKDDVCDEGSKLKDSPLVSKKEKSGRCETAEQGKALLGKKKKVGKVVGKVKLSSGQTLEVEKVKAEEVVAEAEEEGVHEGKGSKYLHTRSAFRKVTSWLGQKPAKKASLKARLLSVARAIGISRWLWKKFGKRKRSSKPSGFRSRVAIRIVSTAGWLRQSGRAFPGTAGQLGEAELSDKESSPPLVEVKDSPKMAEGREVGHIDLPSDDSPLHGSSSFPYLLSLDEEKNNATDAKFAVVFPRVHSMVKTNSSLARCSGNVYSLEKLRSLLDRKSVMPVQQGCRFNCDLPRSLMDQSPQKNSAQGFLPHQEEDPIHTSDYSSEVDVKEGSGVLQTAGSIVTPGVHWSQQQAQGCDPAAWLNSELLLPRLTIENLSKWAIYKDPHLANSHVMKVCKDQWEAEDITDNMLEMEFMQKQVYMCEDHCGEVEEIEDLTRLEHIFAIAEMAYTLSQSSEQEQCVIISGHSGSGKTEAAKAIVRYLTMLYQGSDSHRIRQPCNVLPILESFGNARTILNDNSSRFGKLLNVYMQHGIVVGTSISQYLLEKSRVVFQAHGERNYHVFYELLAGLPVEQKEKLYLQEAESYFYLNQGRACDVLGKEDSQDFLVLVQALEGISLSADQLTSTWAVLAAILQLGNICFISYEKESYEHAAIASDTEIQIVANLLRVSADYLQSAITHRVTVTSYDRIFTPLSVEGAIDARDSIAKTLYYLLFEWLLLRINEWLAPWESDCAVGIVDIHGFEDLEVNSLEQLCINFANEHLQCFFSQTVIAQEEEEYRQEQLDWIPISKMYSESCLDFIAAKPHGILRILDDQTSLTQATDHTFLQKCHYHHGDSPWYVKPKLPLPVFTVKHYAGPVTYQVHKFLNKNRDQLRPEVLDIFSQSHLKVVSHIFQKAKAAYSQQREMGARGKGLKPQAFTLVSRFQQSLQDLTAKLRRSHAFFIRCITPNPKKLSNIFDVEYVTCQLRHSGILEAIHIRKEGYPVRLPFRNFLARYGLLAGQRHNCLEEREGCVAVLSRVVGNPSDLYQIGVTKVFLKEKARQLLERRWNQRQTWAIVTLQRKFRCLLRRRRLRVLQEKATIIQAHFRGYQARKRYRRLKKTLVQFNTMILISRPLIQRRKYFQILRFIGDKNLHGWQEILLGNYIAGRGLNNVALRNEIFSQVVTQAWKNPDMEHSQRAWVLMATLLSCFAPSPALEKPLLKFVSDYGMDGYNAVCQRKILTAAQHTEIDSTFSRAYPPTQLEWIANQRRGKMVLDVHTFNEEKFSAEVESWMTGEQYAGWLLSARGCDKKCRGWSISMFTGNTWQDLLGCDFVMDLIGEMEELSNISSPSQSSAEYPITPERDRSFFQNSDLDSALCCPHHMFLFNRIPPAPGIQAPSLPPPSLPPEFNNLHPDPRFRGDLRMPVGLDHYVDDLFDTVLHQGSRVPDMENRESLTGRMKGGGKIGPTQRGIFPSTGFSGMTQTPVYQPMPSMMGMPAAMPMMPAAGGIAPMPAMVMPQPVVPTVDPSQLAAQQQAFINQQAMLMVYDYTEDQFSDSEDDDCSRETFQQKRAYFQKMGQQHIRVKKVRPPSKTWTPPANPQPQQEEEEEEVREKKEEEKPSPKPEAAPAPLLPPPEPKPKKQTPKAKKEPPVVKPSGPESRPAPSREIRNIIKMYQSRPAPEPQPIEPVRRVSKPFIKKNDPKNEALAKLGMMNLASPKSPNALPQEKRTPPPPPPKPKISSASSSIKEKQLPLLSVFSQESTPPGSQAPPAPPLPPPLPSPLLPESPGGQESTGKDSTATVTVAEDDGIKTQLYKLTDSISFSYDNPAWKIFLRKEVFYPKENFSHPYCLNLLCEQIMRDTFSDSCLRISKEEKRKMKDLLMEFRVGNDVQSIQEDGIKKRIVLAARDNWANYFSRLFPARGENGSDVQILGVSHRGMRLLKVVKAAGYNPEHLKILRSYSFADVISVELKGNNALEFSLKTEQLLLYSPKALSIKATVELFIQELRQDTNYVIALRSYIADDKSFLSFEKGDLIKLLPMQGVEPGWQFGSTGGRCGIFPTSLVQLAAAPDYLSTSMDRHGGLRMNMKTSPDSRITSKEVSCPWGTASLTSEPSNIMVVPTGDHYTMVDFATAYFREAQSTLGLKGVSSEKKGAANLVQHTKVPIQESLLRFSDSELNELATKNFKTLMRFMGDQSKLKNQNDVECIYEILQVAKEVLQEICEQMGAGEQEEMEEFVLFAIRDNNNGLGKVKDCAILGAVLLVPKRDKTVRPIKPEEYLHDYLLEDNSVTVTLRRLMWTAPLHFENKIYTDVHYRQVLWDYLNGKILLGRTEDMEMQVGILAMLQHYAKTERQNSAPSREDLEEYTPKTLQSSISPQALQNKVGMLLRTRQALQPLDAKIQFIEHVMKLPFFGYTTFFVKRVSDMTIPVPCYFGVNKEEIIAVDGTTQTVSCVIPLKELQNMRTLRPTSDDGLPGIELNYGSPASPKMMWLELSQAKEMYHTIVVILKKTE